MPQAFTGFVGPISGTTTYNQRYGGSFVTEQDAIDAMHFYFPGWQISGPTSSGVDYGTTSGTPQNHVTNGWNASLPEFGSTFITVPAGEGEGNGNVYWNWDSQVIEDGGEYYIEHTKFYATFQVINGFPTERPGPNPPSC